MFLNYFSRYVNCTFEISSFTYILSKDKFKILSKWNMRLIGELEFPYQSDEVQNETFYML